MGFSDFPMKNCDSYGFFLGFTDLPIKNADFYGFLGFWDVRMILRWLSVNQDGFIEIHRCFFLDGLKMVFVRHIILGFIMNDL